MRTFFCGGNIAHRLLRDRGRLRSFISSLNVSHIRKRLEKFLSQNWKPAQQRSSKIPVSLTTWGPRIPDLPLVLITLLQQTLRPDEIVVWLTKSDLPRIDQTVRTLFGEFGVSFRECDDLGCHKKWLPMITNGQRTPFAICDDDILLPSEWFENLISESLAHPEAYVGMRAHRINRSSEKDMLPYGQWEKDIAFTGVVENDVFITGAGGAVIHPDRINPPFLDWNFITQHCPRADDIWLHFAHRVNHIPAYKTKYSFPCIEIPGSDKTGLARTNVGQNRNDSQLASVIRFLESL